MKAVIPNRLTIFRMGLIPVTFWMLGVGQGWVALGLFGVMMLTDFWDGRLARRWGVESSFGALWDPIADKLVVMSFFLFFYLRGELPLVVFSVIFLRDVCQLLCVPTLIHGLKIQFKVKPIFVSQLSTAVNLVLLFLLILNQNFLITDPVLVAFMFGAGVLGVITSVRFLTRLSLIILRKHDTFD